MIISTTKFEDVFVFDIKRIDDERGFFARIWDKKKSEEFGINFDVVQTSVSFNKKKGTIRGMHYQINPFDEIKLVRCTKGKIFDVIVDLRSSSHTFGTWLSIELSEENHKTLYIPKGFAHGFQTLENCSEVYYQISEYYNPEFSRGILWNDPKLKIDWPLSPTIISRKDLSYPHFISKQ